MSESSGVPLTFITQIIGMMEAANKIKSLAEEIRQFGEDALKSSSAADKTSVSITQLASQVGNTANSFNSAAKSATDLYFKYDNLEKVALRVEKAERGVTVARASLLEAQDELNELTAKGITQGPAYEEAQRRLETAEYRLHMAKEKHIQSQEDLTQSQMIFAQQVIPGAISAVTNFNSGLTQLRSGIIATRLSSLLLSSSAGTLGPALNGAAISSTVAAGGVRGFGLAVRGAMVAMGPLGWTMIALTTVFGLVATNAFGIRDAIHALGKAIGDAVPVLKPFLEWLGEASKTLFPDTEQGAQDMGTGVSASVDSMATRTATATGKQEESLASAKAAFTATQEHVSTETDALADSMESNATRVVSSAARMKEAMEGLGGAAVAPAPAITVQQPPAATSPDIDKNYRLIRDPLGPIAGLPEERYVYDPYVGTKRVSESVKELSSGTTSRRDAEKTARLYEEYMRPKTFTFYLDSIIKMNGTEVGREFNKVFAETFG